MSTRILLILTYLWAMMSGSAAFAQAFPSRPVQIVCSGSSQEALARLIADGITEPLGQQVVIVNRPTVPISSEYVAKSKPDGYTALLAGSNFYVNPLTQKMNYDPVKDFAPLTIVGKAPLIVFVHPSVPVHTIKEFIEYAKTKPGQLHTSLGALGGGGHIAVELLNSKAGIRLESVPYSAGSQEVADVVSGRVEMTISPLVPFMEQAKAGRLRALAVTSATTSPMVPDLPPIASVVPGYEFVNMTIMALPAGTPAPIVARLNREIVRTLNNKEVKERFFNVGLEVVASTPEEFGAILDAETAKIRAVVKAIGLEPK